jgi:hypothetical protein
VAQRDPHALPRELGVDAIVPVRGVVHAGDAEHVVPVDPIVVGGIREGQRQDAEVDQVLPVDPREALGDHHAQGEIARRQRGVLAARALAVVLAADQRVAALVAHPLARAT